MADISEVLVAMVTGASSAIYPSGTGSPSIIAADVKIYAGWPVPAQLDTDLPSSICHVTFWARPEIKNVRQYRDGATGENVAGKVRKEIRRQERSIQVSVWSSDPAQRDTLGIVVDAFFAINPRLTASTGEVFYVRYKSEAQVDEHQKTNIYRRDLILSAEYPTSHDLDATPVTTVVTNVTTM